nr:immunoglobulin light chain junction region [Macaca mulatta]MOX28840.1 immunoglobulin light chain junction region [Macaca mulatta]MOX28998.1 immunoglobulin light chain junction region [Macaca mulatta]MOX30002.1 immunoglobulin light chain junction region [Macaca mulatta]MOX30350.1 immunoglobulin light chain junction region [Macaca mulatta]
AYYCATGHPSGDYIF